MRANGSADLVYFSLQIWFVLCFNKDKLSSRHGFFSEYYRRVQTSHWRCDNTERPRQTSLMLILISLYRHTRICFRHIFKILSRGYESEREAEIFLHIWIICVLKVWSPYCHRGNRLVDMVFFQILATSSDVALTLW